MHMTLTIAHLMSTWQVPVDNTSYSFIYKESSLSSFLFKYLAKTRGEMRYWCPITD